MTGTPTLVLGVGQETRLARYRARSGTDLLFRYTVQVGDTDTDGISILADALESNTGSIRGLAGLDAALDLGSHAIVNHPEHRVSGE